MKIKEILHQLVEGAGKKSFGSLPEFDIVEPPQKEFGDFSTALPLQLSRKLKKDPAVLARRIKTELDKTHLPEWISEVTITRPGYLNFVLDYQVLAKKIFKDAALSAKRVKSKPKTILEHTQVNPNKAAHVGHVRNAVLGDSLARLLRFCGENVEVQNYIDNTGVQVADSYLAWRELAKSQELRAKGRLDHLLWKLYPQIQTEYEKHPALLKERARILQILEEGNSKESREVLTMTREVVKNHLATFARLGVFYDLMVWEGDILKIKLWEKVFNWLKKERLIVQEKRGLNKGAWVMRFGENAREDKILVKSDGTATYTAKDIAYHLWKFGLAKADFNYAIWNKQENGEMLWTTKEGSDKKAAHPKNKFGHADKVINVIDARQAYPQNIVKEALRRLGFKQQAANYRHLAYGVVYLSAKSLETLGYVIPKNQEEKSSFAISGRAGIGVMADDLMAKVEEKVRKINPKLNAAEIKHLSAAIIRYYLLSLRPEKDVTFDIDAALQVDGNTGAYLQYAYARACHILQKAKGRPSPLRLPTILSASETALLKQLTFLEEVIDEAAENLNPSLLCDYLWNLANGFAKFYETSPVLSSEEPARSFRLRLTAEVKTTLATGLQLLGITPLEKI